jgi:hypothetical protein
MKNTQLLLIFYRLERRHHIAWFLLSDGLDHHASHSKSVRYSGDGTWFRARWSNSESSSWPPSSMSPLILINHGTVSVLTCSFHSIFVLLRCSCDWLTLDCFRLGKTNLIVVKTTTFRPLSMVPSEQIGSGLYTDRERLASALACGCMIIFHRFRRGVSKLTFQCSI